MPKPDTPLTETHRAAIRLMVIGVRQTDAAEIHGLPRPELSRAYHSPQGQEYAAHIRGICEHYTAAMHVLGLVPHDITRPGCKYRTPNPPSTAANLRRAAREGIQARLGKGLARLDGGGEAREEEGTDGDQQGEGEPEE